MSFHTPPRSGKKALSRSGDSGRDPLRVADERIRSAGRSGGIVRATTRRDLMDRKRPSVHLSIPYERIVGKRRVEVGGQRGPSKDRQKTVWGEQGGRGVVSKRRTSTRNVMSSAIARFANAIREALAVEKRPKRSVKGRAREVEGTTRDRSAEFAARRQENWKRRSRRRRTPKESPQAKQLQQAGSKTMELKKRINVAIIQYAQVIESVHWELEDDSLSPSSKRALLATLELLHEEVAEQIAELKRVVMVDIPQIDAKSLAETALKRSLSTVAGETLRITAGTWRHLSKLCLRIQKSDDAAHATRMKKQVVAKYECKEQLENLHRAVCAVGDMLFSEHYLRKCRSALAPAIHSTKASLSRAIEFYEEHETSRSCSRYSLVGHSGPIVAENFKSVGDILQYLTQANDEVRNIFNKHSASDSVYREEMSSLLQTLKVINGRGVSPSFNPVGAWMN